MVLFSAFSCILHTQNRVFITVTYDILHYDIVALHMLVDINCRLMFVTSNSIATQLYAALQNVTLFVVMVREVMDVHSLILLLTASECSVMES